MSHPAKVVVAAARCSFGSQAPVVFDPRTRGGNLLFGICEVLHLPRPIGTCHALGALPGPWPKGQRVNWRQKRPFASSHFQLGGSIL